MTLLPQTPSRIILGIIVGAPVKDAAAKVAAAADKVDALEKRRAADDAADILRREIAEKEERAAEKRADLIKTAIGVIVWFFTHVPVKP